MKDYFWIGLALLGISGFTSACAEDIEIASPEVMCIVSGGIWEDDTCYCSSSKCDEGIFCVKEDEVENLYCANKFETAEPGEK